jgi:CRP-like cAMP-binding protein
MRQKVDCVNCPSTDCFVIKYCTGETLEKLSAAKNQNFYRKGDYIFREGNTMLGIHFVQKGGVKVVTPNVHGREQVVRLASDGNILGHRVLGNDKYYFNAIALIDTTVCFVETAVFKDTCMHSPEFAYNLLLFYALELRRTELRVKYQATMNIREKVAEAFVYLSEIYGINSETGTLNIEMNRQEIADVAGTTPEQVSRQLSDFEDEKLILREKRDIRILNKKGLEDIVKDYKIE